MLIAHDTRARAFLHPADENNPYAYAHTSDDILGLPAEIADMARRNGIATPRIAVIASDPWPMPWYLRHFDQVGSGSQAGRSPMQISLSLQPTQTASIAAQLRNFRPEFFGVTSRRSHPVVVTRAQMKSMAEIHQFNHHAMATYFQVRIDNQDKPYAVQAAQAALDLVDGLEARLSRFRANSEIAQIAHLASGEKMRLSEPTFACLQIAKQMEEATHSAFCPMPAAFKDRQSLPRWELRPDEHSILCVSGPLEFDLGAIGKGFALDRMGELLRQWDCPSFLLIAGGSSISRWRSARRCSWLVLWPGRRRFIAEIFSDARFVERFRIGCKGSPHSRSAYRSPRVAAKPGMGSGRYCRRIGCALNRVHGS